MSRYYKFNEHIFRDDVESALETVEKILEADRRPLLAEEVHHKYENKFDLANQMTNIAIVAQMNVLERLGLTPQIIQQLVNVKRKSITLRFDASETYDFLKEQTVDVPDPHAVETVSERSSILRSTQLKSTSSTVHKIIKKVKEYHWTIKAHWEISVFSGTDVDKKIMIQSRDSSTVVITQSKDAPMEKVENHAPLDLNLTWLLQQIDMEKQATTFAIDTNTAKTPRRNEQVDASMTFFCSRMKDWLVNVQKHFAINLQRIISRIHNPAVPPPSHPEKLANQCSAKDLFLPILPLLEVIRSDIKNDNADGDEHDDNALNLDSGNNAADSPPSVSTLALPSGNDSQEVLVGGQSPESKLLSGRDTILLKNAQVLSIDTKLKSLNQIFPSSHETTTLFSIAEATVYLLLEHSQRLCLQYQYAIGYLESILEKQLIAAIGKRVTNDDLEEFIRFHNAKFLTIPPRPFCHAIGRPKRFPYGMLSIESKTGHNDKTIPVETMMRPVLMSTPLEVSLNAATTLHLTGNTYLHGWMRHRSEGSGGINKAFQLSARARQFSSFLLVIGTMAGPNKLNPKDAIILQNKDKVLIPLLLEEIPSAKEFRDAIESLSPEQQRFAKAFRGMQLESSVFGVAVIQIKPQLEALLGLAEDSLAKEIKLTEDLMELFVTHQIPSDLLSFDGNGDGMTLSSNQKVDAVRRNVKAVMDVIEGEKEKQLEKALMEEETRKAAAEARAAEEARRALATEELCRQSPVYDSVEGSSSFRAAVFKQKRLSYSFGSRGIALPSFGATMAMAAPEGMTMAAPPPPAGARPPAPLSAVPAPKSAAANQNIVISKSLPVPTPQAARPKDVDATVQSPTFDSSETEAPSSHQSVDFTNIPKALDATIEKYDKDGNLRSTKLKSKDTWSRKRQPDLLTKPSTKTLSSSEVKSESNKAYDLLDAISRNGSLPIAYSDVHVVVCVTHCFEKDIIATLVEDNVNPIEKLEMSTLLLGSAIHGANPLELIAEESDRTRFQSSFPLMIEAK